MIPDRFRFLLLGIACALLAALPFLPGLSGGFVFDDNPNIVENQALHVTTLDADSLLRAVYSFQPGGGSRALPELSFAFDHWRAGLDPQAFKATNLLIHAITTVALGYFLRLLLVVAGWPVRRASIAALAMAVAWAVHPLQVSSVLYVVQRMQTMATLFVILSLWSYVRARHVQQAGDRSRPYWISALLFGALAFASKEDAILLPVYALALELTLLRFRAHDPAVTIRLRKVYLAGTAIAVVLFLAVVLPHYWRWDPYPGRDFSTYERLLTQGRVLVMYLGQILWPLPDRLPFYYDHIAPSRGLLQPATTLPSLLLVAALLGIALRLRARRPILSLGILLFFAGHLLTSNVVGLELAFEHRNHLPLAGIVLAVADLLDAALRRTHAPAWVLVGACLAISAGEAAGTWQRSQVWGDTMTFARHSTAIAPQSARAWLELCGRHYARSGKTPGPELDRAIAACSEGAKRTGSLSALGNVVVFKTIRGDVAPSDWTAYLDRLRVVAMSPENRQTIWTMVVNASRGLPLDDENILDAIDIASRRTGYSDVEYARLGYFILEQTDLPDRAYPYLALAVRASPPGSMLVDEMVDDLAMRGRTEWSTRLDALARSNAHAASH